jgi:hypothetical protein
MPPGGREGRAGDDGTQDVAKEQTDLQTYPGREIKGSSPETLPKLESGTAELFTNIEQRNAEVKKRREPAESEAGLFSAYQSEAMADVAAAEQDFMEQDHKSFEEIKTQTLLAAEAARVAKLKNAEALAEVKHWSSLQDRVNEEIQAATDCLDKAELLINRETDLSSHLVCKLKEKLHGRVNVAAGRPILAENLLSRVQELRHRAQERERHTGELVQAASRLEATAARKVMFIDEITKKKANDQATMTMYEQESQQLCDLAETDYEVAVEKINQLERSEVAPSMQTEIYTQARVLAERASVKANGAKLALQAAQNAGERVKRVTSILTQTKRDVTMLLRRAQELISYADSLTQGTEALRDQAYEKAKEADTLLSARGSDQSTDKQLEKVLEGEEDEELQSTLKKMEALAEECGNEAEELIKEAKRHELISSQLQREVDMAMNHVPRVLHDAEIARQHEEEALLRVRMATEVVLSDAERRMEEEWTRLDIDDIDDKSH